MSAAADWRFGAELDGAYEADLNHPDNHVFRSRSTTAKLDEPVLNMAMAYAHKDAVVDSRLGFQLSVQTGKDSRDFGYSATSPNIQSGDALRHFGQANISYLAPVGRGLTLQGGLFNSIIGEESLYAKDNFNYTRSWIADYSPYLMFGGNASYPLTDATTAGVYVINEYFHLSQSNGEPAYGAFVSHKATSELTIKETLFYGPDQEETSIRLWRLFTDSIAEWKRGRLSAWIDNQAGTERVADRGGHRVFWEGAALGARWSFTDRIALALRPEFYWDHDGRLTGSRQLDRAITTTFEYKLPFHRTSTTLRLEHRYDESTGPDGGFFYGKDSSTGTPTLRQKQHLLIAALIWTFDSP
ncbi:MAG: porin [Elusimicrobia bacterium]|nr:porin [Elusimicrobiota bacterium]MDE2425531.1 porin [Elusimicrobiota bacterium]